MFRFAFVALALMAFGSLLAGAAGTAGLLVLAPLFIIGKLFLILVVFGAVGGFFWRGYDGGRPSPPWTRFRQPRRDEESTEKNQTEQFEEWHRMAHARDEVDSWVEGLE